MLLGQEAAAAAAQARVIAAPCGYQNRAEGDFVEARRAGLEVNYDGVDGSTQARVQRMQRALSDSDSEGARASYVVYVCARACVCSRQRVPARLLPSSSMFTTWFT